MIGPEEFGKASDYYTTFTMDSVRGFPVGALISMDNKVFKIIRSKANTFTLSNKPLNYLQKLWYLAILRREVRWVVHK